MGTYLNNVTNDIIGFVNRLPDSLLHSWYEKYSVYTKSDLIDFINLSSESVRYDLFTAMNILKSSLPETLVNRPNRYIAPAGNTVRSS